MTEPDLYALMREYIPEELHADFERMIRKGLRLRHARDGDEIIGYFGGLPELPAGFAWPGSDRYPCEHVATIDLATLPTTDLNLPTSGRISIFGDTRGQGGAFHYFPTEMPTREATPPPALVAEDRIFKRVPMAYAVVPTIPSITWMHEHLLEQGDYEDQVYEQFDALGSVHFRHSWSWHQLGGCANEIQGANDRVVLPGSPAEQHFCPDGSPSGQILIAQFDTDNEIGMGWGDFGTLYCFIDPKDLAASNFADVNVYWDCY